MGHEMVRKLRWGWAAITQPHRLAGLNHRRLLPAAREAGFLLRPLSLTCRQPSCPCVPTQSPLCACLCPDFLCL